MSFSAGPTILKNPPESHISVEGSNVTITCRAFGKPLPVITWLFNGKAIEITPRITWTNHDGFGLLTIRSVNLDDQGYWTCVASNSKGTIKGNNDCRLTIKCKFHFQMFQPFNFFYIRKLLNYSTNCIHLILNFFFRSSIQFMLSPILQWSS